MMINFIKKMTVLSMVPAIFFLAFSLSCTPVNNVSAQTADTMVKGADISWLPQMEASGFVFYSQSGIPEDCFQILKDNGINTIRLRTWVNPSDDKHSGHCSKSETIEMAKRAKAFGMKLLLDFHYSDSWADPGNQRKPAAWEGHDKNQLAKDVYDYTKDVMTGLAAAGIYPEWVQIGNEIALGMLFPEGRTSNWGNLASLLNQGSLAVKAVSPDSKIIIHIDQGNNNGRCRTWYDSAVSRRVKFDIIGLSYYPYWLKGRPDFSNSIDNLGDNLIDMAGRYHKELMIVEVGGEEESAKNTYDMLVAVQKKIHAVPGNMGLGLIYWEPEGAKIWSGYPLSAWEDSGKPNAALSAFLIP